MADHCRVGIAAAGRSPTAASPLSGEISLPAVSTERTSAILFSTCNYREKVSWRWWLPAEHKLRNPDSETALAASSRTTPEYHASRQCIGNAPLSSLNERLNSREKSCPHALPFLSKSGHFIPECRDSACSKMFVGTQG
jgi:hypothetical protein